MTAAANTVSIVVPTRNEVENVGALVSQIIAAGVAFHEIIFVDGDSRDGTREQIRALGVQHPVRLIEQDPDAPGLAAAIMAGARVATGEVLLVMDADLSHPPERINDLLAPLLGGSADMVIGSRYVKGGSTSGWPLWRKILSRAGSALAYPVTGVHDSMCGFFAIKRARLLQIAPPTVGFKIAFETIVRARSTMRIREIPITFRDRTRGQSKMSFGIAFRFFVRWLAAVFRRLFFVGLICGLAQTALAREQEFRFEKPDAQSVAVLGEFNNWKAQAMTKQNDGTWTTTITISPGTYGYKFLVNGSDWVFDPKNPNRKTVEGVENSSLEVADAAARSTSTPSPSPPSSVGEAASFPGKPTASPTSTGFASSATLSPTPGEILTLEVPLSDKRRAEAAKDGNPKLAHAKAALAVPQNFDAQKSWPILVISNTEAYSNIDSLQQFKQAAVDEGWVVMAADAVEAEKNKEGGVRWPTIAAAFDYITAAWPAVKDWPVACGGMSGGAKNSAFLAADLAREHHRIIGMLMMGCNQDMATVAYRKSAPPNFLRAAIFLSSGKSDKIATPEAHEFVKNSLRGTGFQKVRLESFDGAHDIYPPHIGEALRWFVAESSKSSGTAARPASDFDKFFKKKP